MRSRRTTDQQLDLSNPADPRGFSDKAKLVLRRLVNFAGEIQLESGVNPSTDLIVGSHSRLRIPRRRRRDSRMERRKSTDARLACRLCHYQPQRRKLPRREGNDPFVADGDAGVEFSPIGAGKAFDFECANTLAIAAILLKNHVIDSCVLHEPQFNPGARAFSFRDALPESPPDLFAELAAPAQSPHPAYVRGGPRGY